MTKKKTPGTSREFPRPFPYVLPEVRLKPGEAYLGWRCRTCTLPIIIDSAAALAAHIPDYHFVAVQCQQCGQTESHTWKARAEFQYGKKAPISLACSHCKTTHAQGGYTDEQLRALLWKGEAIEGLCIQFGEVLRASPQERARIAKALAVSNWC